MFKIYLKNVYQIPSKMVLQLNLKVTIFKLAQNNFAKITVHS